MQQQVQNTYDYRQYDQVWQRVSPTLDPYPGMRSECGAAQPPASGPACPVPELPSGNQNSATQAEENLPGAQENPCCMGSAAMEMLEVLQGFIEEELADRRYYLAFARQAPSWARQTLRETAEDEGSHARQLMTVYYLITGQCYHPAVSYERIYIGQLCPALRARYHAEACGGFNYARAADGTTDPCLAKLLNKLSEDEYLHAERMMALLERAMKQQ